MRFNLSPFKSDSGATRPSGGRLLRDDTRFALVRIAVFQYASVGIMLFLLGGFWMLQVRDHDINSELAERNRIKTVRLDAPRGKILDRDGRVIVDNQSAFAVNLSRENLNEEHLLAIADGLNIPLEDLQNAVRRYANRPRYVPIRIKTELTAAELAFVESHRDQQTFPELDLVETPRRLYPKDGLAAHVLG